ncbi:hypothetical protein CHS0354_015935, partial [Potamilus streckersoni]
MILNQIYGNLDFTTSPNQQEGIKPKTCNANLKRKTTHPAYTYIKEQTQTITTKTTTTTISMPIWLTMSNIITTKDSKANEPFSYTQHDQEPYKPNQSNTEIEQSVCKQTHDTIHITQTQVKNKTSKVRYANDQEKPGPSKTHTIEELREIMAALSQDTLDTLQDSNTKLPILDKIDEPATYCGKGKQPLRGPPRVKKTTLKVNPQLFNNRTELLNINRKEISNNTTFGNDLVSGQQNRVKRPRNNEEQPQTKRPRTELKTQQYNSTTINDKQVSGKDRPQPKHKLQPHPRYLTLYLKSPNNISITLSDSAIRIELLKHKSGNIKIIRTKSSDIIIWCFSGAQNKPIKKLSKLTMSQSNYSISMLLKGTPQQQITHRHRRQMTASIPHKNKQTKKDNQKGDFLIWQWNCRDINANCRELQANLQETENKPMIICLQEIKLRTKNSKLPKLKEYEQTYLKDRGNGKLGGGLAFYVHNDVTHTKLIDFTSNQDESIEHGTNRRGIQIYRLIDKLLLNILNNGTPTRMCPHTGNKSTLDLTITTRNIVLDTHWEVLTQSPMGSDHFPIQIGLRAQRPPIPGPTTPNWIL